jgi:hypothetical protein
VGYGGIGAQGLKNKGYQEISKNSSLFCFDFRRLWTLRLTYYKIRFARKRLDLVLMGRRSDQLLGVSGNKFKIGKNEKSVFLKRVINNYPFNLHD